MGGLTATNDLKFGTYIQVCMSHKFAKKTRLVEVSKLAIVLSTLCSGHQKGKVKWAFYKKYASYSQMKERYNLSQTRIVEKLIEFYKLI